MLRQRRVEYSMRELTTPNVRNGYCLASMACSSASPKN